MCLAALCIHSTVALTGGDVVTIVAGIMDGVIHKDDLAELQTCMTGADSLTDEFESAVADFEAGGIQGITQGIMEVAQIFNDLPQDLGNCVSISDDLSKLGDQLKIFLQPTLLIKTVSYNLVWHYSEINGDIQTALTDYNSMDYFGFGEQLGEALVLATQQWVKWLIINYYLHKNVH